MSNQLVQPIDDNDHFEFSPHVNDTEDEEDHEGFCLSDEHTSIVRATDLEFPTRQEAICRFTAGSLMAFASGLSVTVNNLIIKETGADFGEVLAIRGLLQMPVMIAIACYRGHSLIPKSSIQRILTCLVGMFGALTTLCTYVCIFFIPVGDAMTLIFTSPLFTIIFAAIFLKHSLSCIKVVAGLVLLVGIILVTKPPFLFDIDNQNMTTTLSAEDFADNYLLLSTHNLKFIGSSWSWTGPKYIQVDQDNSNHYIGGVIALGSALFSAANNIVMAKLGRGVPTSVQLFYSGVGCFVISILCTLIDSNDRFYSPYIVDITGPELGIFMLMACIGMLGYFCTIRSLSLVPPSTVSTLRTSQIIIAFIAQVLLTGVIPSAMEVSGATVIFVAALVITFESQIFKLGAKIFSCCSLSH